MLGRKVLMGGLLLSVGLSSVAYADCSSTALYEDMETLKTEMKSLAFDVKSEDYAAADARITKVIEVLREAREETPYLFTEKGITGDELTKRTAEYQSVMDDTITAFTALGDAAKSKDAEKAKTILTEIGNLRKKGHRAFKAEC